jgi:probable HAF family extracellular repeat protein
MRSRRFALLAVLLCTSAAARAFAAASLTSLGDLPGDPSSIANGVSGDGSVVVGNAGGYGGQAYRWTAAGGMVGLGRPPGDFYSYARAVNGDGSVVVGGSQYADVESEIDRTQAARWTAAGGMQGLGHLPGGGAIGVALGVSGDGSVIVGASDSASGYEAFRWTAAGGMQGLGDLPGGGFSSGASGVSGDGSVIVGSSSSVSGDEAFRWTSAGGMVGLGFLPGDLDSQAYGVSADGAIVVGTSSSLSGVHRFRWTSADGMVGLGSLPGGFNLMGFSADGSVVVGYEVQYDVSLSPHYTALYCSADGRVRAFWDVLLSHGVDPAADGWSRLEFAKAISADGSTIVGDGIRNGNNEAFVAVIPTIVPEPAAGALALLGASSILLLRRRCVWRPNKLNVLHFHALAAALMVAIALAPAAASAQEDGTVTISGTFSMDYMSGESDLNWFLPGLVEVYFNGHEHTWTLTLHGTTPSHYTNGAYYATQIHATSFDLEFFGPDAATLNGIVRDHLAGGDVYVYLENAYSSGFGADFAIMYVWVSGGDPGVYTGTYFETGQDMGVDTLFPTDADGYPVVGPEPFSIEPDYTELGYFDMSSGTGGAIGSLAGPVTFEGSMGDLDPGEPVVLAVADVSVLEGNKGTSRLDLTVTLSRSSDAEVTVNYATANSTAVATQDYTATSGTLTFQPGETSRTISVAIKGDRKREANETFSVQLSNAVGATIEDGSATVTILNDD